MKLRKPAEGALLVSAIVALAGGMFASPTRPFPTSAVIIKRAVQKQYTRGDRFRRRQRTEEDPQLALPAALSARNDSIWSRPGERSVVGTQSASLRLAQVKRAAPLDFDNDDGPTFIEVSAEVQTHLDSGGQRLRRPPEQTGSDLKSADGIGLIEAGAVQPSRPQLAERRHLASSRSAGRADAGATYGARPQPVQPSSVQSGRLQTEGSPQSDFMSQMYIDNTMPLEVQSHVGSTAYLVCRLRSIQQQLHLRVSWVRNMQILTSGELRYTSDERFKPTHLEGTHDWVLEVHNVNANDAGSYECQVNSEPKAASVSLQLHVIAVTLEIAEGTEVQVEEEAQIRLTCRVEFVSQARLGGERANRERTIGGQLGGFNSQHYIYWYKDNVSLEYNNPRGGIKVELRENASNLEKGLTIEDAQSSDSGDYVCKLLPELNEVPPARARLTVGGGGGGGGGSSSLFSSVSSGCSAGFPHLARVGPAQNKPAAALSAAIVASLVVIAL